jgi:septum formation protein
VAKEHTSTPLVARPPLVLASASPRRRALLESLGLAFRVEPTDVDETPRPGEAPEELARRLSRLKAQAAARRCQGALVIAADTVVALDGALLGKPRDEAENRAFLERLAGREHEVYTGHALQWGERCEVRVVRTAVRFRPLTAREIAWYAATGEGLDKAGGYAIQGFGATLVQGICGCYFNVVGLSIVAVIAAARAMEVELF